MLTPPKSRSIWRRCIGVVTRLLLFVVLFFVVYFLIALIGLIPVNNDFQPSPDGIEIFLVSSAVHADIVLPIKTEAHDWRDYISAKCFSGDTSKATHMAIGWGNKEFYIRTKTWDDFKVSTAVQVLFWPSDSCMHVLFCTTASLPDDVRSVRISAAQYGKLVAYIKKSFPQNEDGSIQFIENAAHGSDDAFFEAHGYYHCFNTCNCWVGNALQETGIRTGWYTPLPKSAFFYLPE